jgi:hypothetical protein
MEIVSLREILYFGEQASEVGGRPRSTGGLFPKGSGLFPNR